MSYEQAARSLERDIRKTWYNLLLIDENLALLEQQAVAAARRTAQAQANFRAGLIPELSFLQARVAERNLEPAIKELRQARDNAYAGFAMNLGLPRGTRIVLDEMEFPPFASLDEESLLARAASSPNTQTLTATLRTLESTRKATALQALTPSLSLGWNIDPSLQGSPWDTNWFDTSNWSQSSGMFRATIAFRLNGLLPFSREAQGLKDLDANIAKLNTSLALSVRASQLEIDSSLARLEKSLSSLETLGLNVELAQRAYQLTEEAYRAGLRDLMEVQNAELELRKARTEVLKERFTYLTALIDLEYTTSLPFGSLSRSAE